MFTAHTTWARSATTSALEVVPFGVETVVDSSQSGASCGYALLVEGFTGGPVGKPLKHGGSPAGGGEKVLAHLEVVRHEIELGGAELGEVHLLRPGDPAVRGRRPPPSARRWRAPHRLY